LSLQYIIGVVNLDIDLALHAFVASQ